MALRGDFVALKSAIVRLKKLKTTVPQVAAKAAPELLAAVAIEFNAQQSPYGTKWKALSPATVKRWGPHPILQLTGAMAGGIKSSAGASSITLTAPSPAFLHQFGWRRALAKAKAKRSKGKVVAMMTHGAGGPARPIFPNGRVPDKWRQLIRKIAREVVVGTARDGG